MIYPGLPGGARGFICLRRLNYDPKHDPRFLKSGGGKIKGCIQEDRHEVEQFHYLSGTVPQFEEQLLKKWKGSCKRISVPKIVEQMAK